MLNRKQLLTLFLANNRKKKQNQTFIVKGVMKHYFVDPCIQTLLNATAYGDLQQVKTILEDNPGLLTLRGNVVDPAGNMIKNVTAYELALGAGDDEMAASIRESFDKFPGGEKARIEQEQNYEDAIDNMLNQDAYNLNELLQIILDAEAKDVTEELKTKDDFNVNYDQGSTHPLYKKTLREALEEFRKYFAPRKINNGEMHFNYANLQKAFDLYNEKFASLYQASGNNSDKQDLFWRQVIGFIQRGLPACDRQAFARGLYELVVAKKPLERCFDFIYGGGSFPITVADHVRADLGFDYGANRARGAQCGWMDALWLAPAFQRLCQAKASNLQNLHTNKKKFGL